MVSGTARRPSFDISVSDGGGVWLESAAASAMINARVAAAMMCGSERTFNGGSRKSEVLHCSSRQPASPKRVSAKAGRASAENATGRRETDDQEHEKQHEEQPRQELGDGERRAGNR